MKEIILFTIISVFVFVAHTGASEVHDKLEKHLSPAQFESIADAKGFTQKLFAGGNTLLLNVGKRRVLVMIIYGSGVPDVEISAYMKTNDKWSLSSTLRTSVLGGAIEPHDVVVENHEVMIIGRTTGKRWGLQNIGNSR